MTTTPVHSITDEQIAEIEARALMYGESEFIRGIMNGAVLALITRLREDEKDAARYRWLREQEAERGLAVLYVTGWERAATCWAITYPDPKALDAEIDNAMQGEQ